MNNLFIDKLLDLVVALVQGVILAFIAFYLIDRNGKQLEISRNQSLFGIKDFLRKGVLPERDKKNLFREAILIRLCFANGYNFFCENFLEMESAQKRGTTIHVLLATPNSDFVNEIDIIEKRIERNKNSVGHDLDEVLRKLSSLCRYPNFQIRHYNTMYRYSIILGTFKYGPMKAWFNIFLPPKLAIDSKMFFAEDTHDDDNIVANLDEYFESVWNDDKLSTKSAEQVGF